MDMNTITGQIARSQSSPFVLLDEGTAARTRNVIADSMANGYDTASTRRHLAEFIDDSQLIEDIIYTELNFAYSAGIVAFGQHSGAKSKEWQSLPGCCDDCDKLDGRKVKIGQKFSRVDVLGHPPLHVRCGCGIVLDY